MHIEPIANYTASDLKQSGPILDQALQGPVRITRRGQTFVLMRTDQLEQLIESAADPRPQTLADLLIGYDANEVKSRLAGWNGDTSTGREIL